MNESKKSQTVFKIILIFAILGGIILGTIGESGESKEQLSISNLEKMIKIAAFFVIMIPICLYWIIPNTKWGKKHLKLKESTYLFFQYLGIFVGLVGLIATLLEPQMVIRSHLFELLLALFGLNFGFWAYILKSKKATELTAILDEKQVVNITQAAGTTCMLTTGIMIILYFISYHEVFVIEGKVWFLFYIFGSMILFSMFNIVYYKKA
jgi:uncharacterized protein YacL